MKTITLADARRRAIAALLYREQARREAAEREAAFTKALEEA